MWSCTDLFHVQPFLYAIYNLTKNFEIPWIFLIDWVFFLFLIDVARLYPVEWSNASLGAKMLCNIVLDSLRKSQEMAVIYSVLFFNQYFPYWNSLYEPYIQPGILVQRTSSFLIIYASLIWQGISCSTPWKWNSLVHSTLFLSECINHILCWWHPKQK